MQRKSDNVHTENDRETMRVDSNESEIDTWEHFYTPSEYQKLREAFEKEKEEDKDEKEEKAEEEEEDNNDDEEDEEEREEEDDDDNDDDEEDEVDEEEKEEEEEDDPGVYEKEGEQGFNQLYLAVEREDTAAVRGLLMSSLDVNVLESNKNTIQQLHAIAKELLNRKTINAFDRTSLHVASENGSVEITHELLKSDTDTNRCHDPFLITDEMGCADIAKALIEHVGGINAVDKNGETVLHLAARNDRNSLVKILLNQSAKMNAQTRLKHTVNQDHSDELELSKQSNKSKADVGQIPHNVPMHGGSFDIEKTQLSPHLSVKSDCTGQAKPLCGRLSVGCEHAEIVENLILNGANVNACNNDEMTPLHLASKYGHSSIVDILLDNHATVDVNKQAKETPFHLAARNGHADVVDVLLRRGICDFVMTYSETPLHFAVTMRHTKVVEIILKHSRRIYDKLTTDNQKLKENINDFTVESEIRPIELFKPDGRRVSAGIVWTEKITPLETMLDYSGKTALDLAVESTQPEMVKTFLSEERCVYSDKHLDNSFRCMIETIKAFDDYHYKLLSERKHEDTIDIMEVLCYDIHHQMTCNDIKEIARVLMNSSKFNVNYQKYELNTVLHTVIRHCQRHIYSHHTNKSRPLRLRLQTIDDVLQLLLEKGADFNMKNTSGETPLIIASEQGCSHVIQKLFDWEQKSGLKLDLDARDQYGATALIKTAESNDVSAMRLLLSHKASVNLHDYYGFTALHAAVYQPNRSWFDFHFFCKEFLQGKRDYFETYNKTVRRGQLIWEQLTLNRFTVRGQLDENFQYDEKTMRFTEEMVKLLLADNELNVNATDFKGNTPLDLVVKFYERITSETFEALKDRGVIFSLLKSMDETPILTARVIDERGQGPLHRLIISLVSNYEFENVKDVIVKVTNILLTDDRFNLMVRGIFLKPKNFRESANATDNKRRTPLHYAVMPPDYYTDDHRDLARVLLEIGSKINAVDIYGKTPLHYAEMKFQYALLLQYGADERIKDKNGHTPKDLRQLRESVTVNKNYAKNLPIRERALRRSTYMYKPFESVIKNDRVIELPKRKLAKAVRIYSQSPRPTESPDDAIWKIWIENKFLNLNRRISKLKPAIQRFIDRLADGIKTNDGRFECQPMLVGSADEETKTVISADFDFNFRLTKFCKLCDMIVPHPLGPKGYFQLRRKTGNVKRRQRDWKFDCFFNLDQCLISNEVNSRFHMILEHVLQDPNFWQDEHLFEWNLTDRDRHQSEKTVGMCKTVRLRMINPIADGEGDLLFVNVSIDVVACVLVDEPCIGDQLPIDINPAWKADGCTLVFDRPRFNPSKPRDTPCMFSDTYTRISFAPLESRIIRESSPLIKAAYMVCKLIFYKNPKTTYQLKTSLLFCMEALKIRQGYEKKDDDNITKRELAFWVERIMFCFSEFYRHDVYPCYFMPSFRHRVVELIVYHDPDEEHSTRRNDSLWFGVSFKYSNAFDIYFNLCPDDTTMDIPIFQDENTFDFNGRDIIASDDPNWEQFDLEEFIRKLAARNPSH